MLVKGATVAWWHQAITQTNFGLSARSCSIYLNALSWKDLKIPQSKSRLDIAFLKSHLDLSGTNWVRSVVIPYPENKLQQKFKCETDEISETDMWFLLTHFLLPHMCPVLIADPNIMLYTLGKDNQRQEKCTKPQAKNYAANHTAKVTQTNLKGFHNEPKVVGLLLNIKSTLYLLKSFERGGNKKWLHFQVLLFLGIDKTHIEDLVQDYSNSIANTLMLL